ncbi:MAG: hypothetical protein CL450_07560 [Acidimicrobiaceae bacterium]|nr:hypothetical protein [Acidimicrobiaceae bacterium]
MRGKKPKKKVRGLERYLTVAPGWPYRFFFCQAEKQKGTWQKLGTNPHKQHRVGPRASLRRRPRTWPHRRPTDNPPRENPAASRRISSTGNGPRACEEDFLIHMSKNVLPPMGALLTTEHTTVDTLPNDSEITDTVIVTAQAPDNVLRRLAQLEARLGRLETSGAPAPLSRPVVKAPPRRTAPVPNWHGELLSRLQSRREKIRVED